MELTPLQRRIKAAALWFIRRHFNGLRNTITSSVTSNFATVFECDGVHDILYYHKPTGEITIEYYVGKGQGVSSPFMRNAGFYDEVEPKTFTFKSPIQLHA